MGPFFSGGMCPAWGGRTVVMYFHVLIFFEIVVKKCSNEQNDHVNNHPDNLVS